MSTADVRCLTDFSCTGKRRQTKSVYRFLANAKKKTPRARRSYFVYLAHRLLRFRLKIDVTRF